jgi:hypothetical protein
MRQFQRALGNGHGQGIDAFIVAMQIEWLHCQSFYYDSFSKNL